MPTGAPRPTVPQVSDCADTHDGAAEVPATYQLDLLSPFDAACNRQSRTLDALARAISLIDTDPRIDRCEAQFLTRALRSIDRRNI